jgi:chromosome segregation ATPase
LTDGTRTYVEANTLLEPANNSSAMQHDLEEIREVSTQLSQIKKKHDETKRVCVNKQAELDAIEQEIKNLGVQETQAEGPVFQIQSRLETLNDQYDTTCQKIDEEQLTQATYKYMLERLEKDMIATKIKSTELDASVKSKKAILDLESQKNRKTKEERLQAKAIFDNLMKNIELEQKDRQERIFELQKCIQNKEASVSRRIERQRKNAEIAEHAANENKDSSELKMREDLYT